MRADLQRFFGLNIDDMGTGFSALHAAECLAHRPSGSALDAAIEQRPVADGSELLLWMLMRRLTPGLPEWPWEKPDAGLPQFGSVPVDRYEEWRQSRIRRENGD